MHGLSVKQYRRPRSHFLIPTDLPGILCLLKLTADEDPRLLIRYYTMDAVGWRNSRWQRDQKCKRLPTAFWQILTGKSSARGITNWEANIKLRSRNKKCNSERRKNTLLPDRG